MYLYCLILDNDLFDEKTANLIKYVSLNRQKKIMNYHFSVDRKLSLYAALLTRYSIANTYSIDFRSLRFNTTSTGKPFLESNPDLHFNFSHTRSAILCGVSSSGEVGVDIEKVMEPPYEILSHSFHPAEIQMLSSLPDKEKAAFFFTIWTQKEAILKSKGLGITQDLTALNTLAYKNQIFTMKEGSYICSAFAEPIANVTFHTISEQTLANFFSKN